MSSRPVRTDTEIIIPSSQGTAYRIDNLNDKRAAVLDDFAPSVPELDMNMFIASLLWELIRAGDLVMIDLQRLLLLDRICN